MARTGYLIEVYMDANPYSETYGQERTERVLDTAQCQTQQPANYVHVYTYCEMNPNGSYTGNCIKVYEDVEPLSPTYGEQMEEVYTDGVLCPPDSAEADWQTIDTYCEQIAYQPSGKLGNSGYMVTVQQDMGEYSPTYGQTRENRTQDVVQCTPPDTSDVWVEVRRVCHLENGYQDGTVDIYRVNTNEYSPNYSSGAEVVFNEPDSVNCPASQYAPDWTETSRTCQVDANGYNTGYAIVVETDTNPNSSTYNTTRTSTVEDSTNCPYQESSMISWRIINNRGATTDTVTTITLNFNSNFSITASGSLPPVGGTLSGAAIIPASLKSTALTVQSITLGPNQSLPVLYQYSQNPSPYTWNTDGSGTLLVTLWDGDGTGPEWTEVSYVCETVSGYRTGASIIVEEDMNPDSATYGQTRTRTVENDSRCPAQTDGDWVETSWSCQQTNGYNTGYAISVQTDQNPNSSTYNTTRTRLIYDTTRCPISTTAGWTEVSYVCEKVDGKYNTGTIIITEEDMNPGSATYGQTRTRTTTGDSRCVRNENADWVEESYVCEQESTAPNWVEQSRTCEKDGNNYNTGYAVVVELDTNPNSSTYNTTRTITVEDLTNCPIDTTPNWVEQSRTCEKDGNNENTGNAIVVELDTNPYSATYNTTRTTTVQDLVNCPVDTTPNWVEQSRTCQKDGNNDNTGYATVIEIDTNPYSPTYNTTRTSTVEDLANCPLPTPTYNFKLKMTSSGGTDTVVACNSSSTLTRSEATKRNSASIIVGDCVRTIDSQTFVDCGYRSAIISDNVYTIGSQAFLRCYDLETVSIGNSVTSIGNSAFSECYALTNVTIPSGVTSIGESTFRYCGSLTNVTIPSGVTTVGDQAFRNCGSLTNVTIPSGVTSIGGAAFKDCTSMTSITCLATTPPTLVTSIGDNIYQRVYDVFDNTNNCPIYVPAASVNTYKSATGWSNYASRIQAIS